MDQAQIGSPHRLSRRTFLKGTALAAAGLSLTSMAAACGTAGGAIGGAAPAKEKTLSYLSQVHFIKESDQEFDRQVDEWSKSTGVKVKIERIGGADVQGRVAAAVQTKTGPDVIQVMTTWDWLYADSLADVTDVATEVAKGWDGFYPDYEQATKVNGVFRSVPFVYRTNANAYRTDWFKAAGVDKIPDTWDDYIEAGKKLKKYGKPFGQAMGHSEADPYAFWYPWLWSHGGKEVEADGKTIAINSKETLNAVERSVILFDEVWVPGVLSWDDASNNRAYLAEQISCSNNGSSIYFVAKKDFPDVAKNTDHFMNPKGPAGRFHYNTYDHNAVMAYSKNIDDAKKMCAMLSTWDNTQKYLTVGNGFNIGPGPKSESLPIWAQDPKLVPYMTVLKEKAGKFPGYAGPPSAQATQAAVKFIIIDMFAKACSKEFKPKEAVDWAETQLKSIYK